MSSLLLLLRLAGLLALAHGAGRLLVPAGPSGPARMRREPALCTLAGLGLLAALASNASALGLPRAAVLALGYAACLAGWLRGAAGWGALGPASALRAALRGCAPLALALLALHGAFLLALGHEPLANDAVAIWWPKLREVGAGLPPDLATFLPDAHPEYPRGLAWLAAFSAPFGSAPTPMLMLVPLALCTCTCLALREVCGPGRGALGWLVLLAYALLPDVARYAHSGLADLALGALLLVAGVGFARAREDARWLRVCAAGACGAASVKDEGSAVLAIFAFAFACVALRAHARRCAESSGASVERRLAAISGASAWRRLALQSLALLALALPFWILRARVGHAGYSGTIPFLLQPELLAARLAEFPRAFGTLFTGAPAHGILPLRQPSSAAWLCAAVALTSAFWGARRVSAWPAGALAGIYLLVLLATPHQLEWHVWTAADRLALQLVPLSLAAFVAGPRESARSN